jgi:hypothetical protein
LTTGGLTPGYTPGSRVAAKYELTKNFLDLILLTENQIRGASLLPLRETTCIQTFWKGLLDTSATLANADDATKRQMLQSAETRGRLEQLGRLLEIEVPIGDAVLGSAVARVGASPGVHGSLGRVTIVHIIDPGKQPRFYIEYEALKPRLFVVNTHYITSKVFGSRVMGVHNATVGMVYLSQGLFVALPFLPVFIKAGFAGLIYEIAVFYASQKVGEQAGKIHPVLGHVVALAGQIGVPRPNFKPKVVVPRRYTHLEVKSATQGPPVGKQATKEWLDWAPGKPTASERGVPARPKPETAVVHTPQPQPPQAKASAPAQEAPWTGPPRQGHQKVQQQQTQVPPRGAPPPEAGTQSGSPPPQRPRSVQQGQQTVGVSLARKPAEPPVTALEPVPKSRTLSGEEAAADAAAMKATRAERAELTAERATQGRATAGTFSNWRTIRKFTGPDGTKYQLLGDAAKIPATTKGHHVYIWFDRQGNRLYTGKSGSIEGKGRIARLPKGTREPAFNHWINRLRRDHIKTFWIRSAAKVRVYYALPEPSMYALEHVGIDAYWETAWNLQRGQFIRRFGDTALDRYVLAKKAEQGPMMEFTLMGQRS